MKNKIKNEAPTGSRLGHLPPLLRREQNPSEAEISSHSSSNSHPQFSAKGDKNLKLTLMFLLGVFAGALGLMVYLKSLPPPTPKMSSFPNLPPMFNNQLPSGNLPVATGSSKAEKEKNGAN